MLYPQKMQKRLKSDTMRKYTTHKQGSFYCLTNGWTQKGARVVQCPCDVVYTNLSPFLYLNYETY